MKIPIDPLKLAPIVARLFRWWAKSLRYRTHGCFEQFVRENQNGTPMVLALWHGELFMDAGYADKLPLNLKALISQSKDGEFVTRVIQTLGYDAVRGSSSKGGVKALLQAARQTKKENAVFAFTIDGPRGPRHVAKEGIILLAQRAGARIMPVRAYPKRFKCFDKAWDRFLLPMPFSRVDIYMGDPIDVTEEKLESDVMERERIRLERVMSSLGKETNDA